MRLTVYSKEGNYFETENGIYIEGCEKSGRTMGEIFEFLTGENINDHLIECPCCGDQRVKEFDYLGGEMSHCVNCVGEKNE